MVQENRPRFATWRQAHEHLESLTREKSLMTEPELCNSIPDMVPATPELIVGATYPEEEVEEQAEIDCDATNYRVAYITELWEDYVNRMCKPPLSPDAQVTNAMFLGFQDFAANAVREDAIRILLGRFERIEEEINDEGL